MIWFWLCLLSGLVLGLLIVGGLWVDRWLHRRKARKAAEALARQALADLAAATRPVGEMLLNAFRQLVPVINDAAKSIGRFEEAFRAVPAAMDEPGPEPDESP